ncbi:MAG: hypothetical protein IT269_07230, partial [Saprospiraceae bacterium]|nr:hypothetical protein [Saprospiraceae bacterium]
MSIIFIVSPLNSTMITRAFSAFILALLPTLVMTQPLIDEKRDYQWIIGETEFVNDFSAGNILDFKDSVVKRTVQYQPFKMRTTVASVCDPLGKLQAYTNGQFVADKTGYTMQGSEFMTSGPYGGYYGLEVLQGVLMLPVPNSNKLVLIHPFYGPTANPDIQKTYYLRYSTIDMSLNGGKGAMTSYNQLLIDNELDNGMITACRHANGRDWWILVPELATARYFRLLLDPTGVSLIGEQTLEPGIGVEAGLCQAVFSPDGETYVRSKGKTKYKPDTIGIYDFDRCTGLLSNLRVITHADEELFIGSFNAISPDSRYLYHTSGFYLYQYDLKASDIK